MQDKLKILHNNTVHRRIDELEAVMLANLPQVDCPLTHKFVPGMYIREIFMPAGSLITSLIHKTEHPFFILKGSVHVKITDDEWQVLSAPYSGITYPGTRRILYIEQDCVWVTVHKTGVQPVDDSLSSVLRAVELVTGEIIEPHENELLGGVVRNNILFEQKQKEVLCHL